MKEMKSFLLIGQSNMAGRGSLTEVEPIINNSCFMLRNGRWQPMSEPICIDRAVDSRIGGVQSGVGPGASFADEFAKAHPDYTVGLIPCADGGTELSLWMPGMPLFDNAVLQTRLAMRSSSLAGILWHQGETDSVDREKSESYEERLLIMVSALMKELCADVPFIMGELGGFLEQNERFKYYKTVNEMQRHIAATNESAKYAFVSAEGLSSKPDFLHFNSRSQREFGKRYFEAYDKLMKG